MPPPKRGFKKPDRQQWNEVNLDQLNKFEAGAPINPETLAARGLLRFRGQPVKLLGRGSLDKNLQITVHKASESAKAAVEKAGGKLEELGLPTPQPIKRAKKSKK